MGNKIGIITYHFAQNYGAVWQCYALQEYLIKEKNDVYILNAVSEKQNRNNSLFHKKRGIKNWIVNLCLFPFCLSRIQKLKKFKEFVENKLNCTELVHDEGELKKVIDNYKFDILISGSDQVWNPLIPDFEKMFFLPFECQAKKVGYSVSIGRVGIDEIKEFSPYIQDFSCVGVREIGATKVLSQVCEKKYFNTVDPVLLLNKKEWMKFIKPRKENSEYLFCYFLDKNNISESIKIAKKIAKERNLEIKCISMHFDVHSFNKYMINNAGPIEFLNYIYYANTVVTDGYHGTVFSTIYNKEIFSIIHNKKSKDSRIKDYLTMLDLQRRLIYHDTAEYDCNYIDYGKVQELIEEIPNNSYQFLEEAII